MSHRYKLDDGTELTMPKQHLSHSQVTMYLKCPMQYYFRYIEGRKEPPGVALSEGSAAHEAMEEDGIHFLKSGGSRLPTSQVQECFADTFNTKKTEVADWGCSVSPDKRATPQIVLARGLTYMRTYAEDIAPDYTPESAEAEHKFTLNGIPMIAYTDFETDTGVFDYKVSKSNSPYFRKGSAESSMQLSLYSFITKKVKTSYIGLLKDKPEQFKVASTTKTPGDIEYTKAIITSVAKAISAGAFPMCGPEQFLCDPRWCGFWARCRGGLLGRPDATRATATQESPSVNLKLAAVKKKIKAPGAANTPATAAKPAAKKKPTGRKRKTKIAKVAKRKRI